MRLIEVASKKGTYASVSFDKETQEAVKKYQDENGISNPVPVDKLHTTLLYSRKHLPEYEATGDLDEPMVGTVKGFDVWDSQASGKGEKTKCLVLEYNCECLTKRHKSLMDEHEATYDYDEYKPHITMSYDFDGDVDKLPKFTDNINITKETGEDLDLSWDPTKN